MPQLASSRRYRRRLGARPGKAGVRAQPVPLLRMLRVSFAERPRGSGWRAVQRHRIERAAVW